VTPALLRASGLTAGYGKMPILHGVALEVRQGEMVSVIGPNVAGKSTAFKTIVGFLRPTDGRVLFACCSTGRTSRGSAPIKRSGAGSPTCPRGASSSRR
jgi:amidase